jgi:DNA-directed RNA polymerase specialized sigma24 family protein
METSPSEFRCPSCNRLSPTEIDELTIQMCVYSRTKDHLAFASIVCAVEPFVSRLVWPKAFGNWDRAAELKQVAFIDLARKGHSYPCGLPPLVFVRQVTTCASISNYRKEKVYLQGTVTGASPRANEDQASNSGSFADVAARISDDPVETAIFNESMFRATMARKELTDQQAAIFDLDQLQLGLSDREIAARLGITVQAVSSCRFLMQRLLMQAMEIPPPQRRSRK